MTDVHLLRHRRGAFVYSSAECSPRRLLLDLWKHSCWIHNLQSPCNKPLLLMDNWHPLLHCISPIASLQKRAVEHRRVCWFCITTQHDSRHFFLIQSEVSQLARARFPALRVSCTYLRRGLIGWLGSVCLLWLARMITLVLVLGHSIIHSVSQWARLHFGTKTKDKSVKCYQLVLLPMLFSNRYDKLSV